MHFFLAYLDGSSESFTATKATVEDGVLHVNRTRARQDGTGAYNLVESFPLEHVRKWSLGA